MNYLEAIFGLWKSGAMSAAPGLHISTVVLDEQGRIDIDLPCLGCGYNLRGLSPEGICPECATPIGRSQYGNLLRFSNPEWVEQIARGMTWWLLMILTVFVLGVLGGGLVSLFSGSAFAEVALTLIDIAISTISLIAYWKMSTPDPSQNETGVTVRRFLRAFALIGFVSTFAAEGVSLVNVKAREIGDCVETLMGTVQSVAAFLYARQLALRLPDRRLAGVTRLVMWGFASSNALLLLMMIPFTLGGTPSAGSQELAFLGLGLAGVAGFLVFGFWSILLIHRYRKAVHRAAAQARALWAGKIKLLPGLERIRSEGGGRQS